jgi:hypothetical protein
VPIPPVLAHLVCKGCARALPPFRAPHWRRYLDYTAEPMTYPEADEAAALGLDRWREARAYRRYKEAVDRAQAVRPLASVA